MINVHHRPFTEKISPSSQIQHENSLDSGSLHIRGLPTIFSSLKYWVFIWWCSRWTSPPTHSSPNVSSWLMNQVLCLELYLLITEIKWRSLRVKTNLSETQSASPKCRLRKAIGGFGSKTCFIPVSSPDWHCLFLHPTEDGPSSRPQGQPTDSLEKSQLAD